MKGKTLIWVAIVAIVGWIIYEKYAAASS